MVGLLEASTGGVLKKPFLKILQYPQETAVLKSLFQKVAGFKALETLIQMFYGEHFEIFKTTYFEKHIRTTDFSLFQWFTVTWA